MKNILAMATLVGVATFAHIGHAQTCSTYGLIGQKWAALSSKLGACVGNEIPDGVGGRIQAFQYGWVSWDGNSSHPAYAVYGKIGEKWNALHLATGYGRPLDDETSDSNGGRYNLFEAGGSIVFNPNSWFCVNQPSACHAYEVHGAIRQAWLSIGAEGGVLGYPETDQTASVAAYGFPVVPGQQQNGFDGGVLVWRPDGSLWAKTTANNYCPILTGSFYDDWQHGRLTCG